MIELMGAAVVAVQQLAVVAVAVQRLGVMVAQRLGVVVAQFQFLGLGPRQFQFWSVF
ncbi:hypothetical protein IQ254_10675 [Nodosilinea sp. LEGE 07088]|uniref:hypothetical protein n=1 Tax=Nodosilinea sp. LEGE 07088 TaxID=2777968 RepID=UPI0018809E6C|nr:hypothetical protein [Nodosilinea sp. LEGE 07088]MBE9137673.1 hypothetical protein [Nodosilinea sp. LEGE 07088]